MSIAAQREWKRQQVVDVLTRIGGFTGVTTGDAPETLETDSPQHWRVNPVVGTAEVYGECPASAAMLCLCMHSRI
jgi:tRNA/tmRNA/rRNA uracil-C5-methylase (TrmA/RlmC/RlmD family)